jgi:integrase
MCGAATVAAAGTGVRRGELCGSRWGDFEWSKSTEEAETVGKISVRRVIKHKDGRGWLVGRHVRQGQEP